MKMSLPSHPGRGRKPAAGAVFWQQRCSSLQVLTKLQIFLLTFLLTTSCCLHTKTSIVNGQSLEDLSVVCGPGSTLQGTQCVCDVASSEETVDIAGNTVYYIAGVFDLSFYDWVQDIFDYQFNVVINNSEETVTDKSKFVYTLHDSNCDETSAVRGYWNARTQNGNVAPHGVIGCRCSGASIAVARIATLEVVPQISPYSTSSKLSNKQEFPYFSRLLSPDGPLGETGAVVAMLRYFQWERVTLLLTDTQYATDWSVDFRKLWNGKHQDASGKWFGETNSATVDLQSDGTITTDSIKKALSSIPTDPVVSSRIIVLVAHTSHAHQILQIAKEIKFQPDTIWTGPSSWVDRDLPTDLSKWLPKYPGYIGIAPYRNRNIDYDIYMEEFNTWRVANNKDKWEELPSVVAEVVDSITSLTTAILETPKEQRRNGEIVSSKIREYEFDGLTGHVEFTSNGDRKNPIFSILNLQRQKGSDGSNEPKWVAVGETQNEIGTATLYNRQNVCFPQSGCVTVSRGGSLEKSPDDKHPIPSNAWKYVLIVLPFILIVSVLAFKYWRSKKSKAQIRAELDAFRDSVVGMRTAETDYIPRVAIHPSSSPSESATAASTASSLLSGITQKMASAKEGPKIATNVQWCWKEHDHMMDRHTTEEIFNGEYPSENWIKYRQEDNVKLEAAYQKQNRKGTFSLFSPYVVDFTAMMQTNTKTNFHREVMRYVDDKPKDDIQIDINLDVQHGGELPADLIGEPQMVLVKGDIIQMSTQRADGWGFGTKLQHADEAAARNLVAIATSKVANVDDANVLTDTGWFELKATKIPAGEDLALLQKNVGDTSALKPPEHWGPVKDPTIAQLHKLKKNDPDDEYTNVYNAFMSTLKPPKCKRDIKVLKISRIQNLAMWQSFVVKRQTICYRETGLSSDDIVTKENETIRRKALERFERAWLWHGTNAEVMDKIMQQGFNRSFCGKNATFYGKGVYFARDASYSANSTYSVPDSKGHQYIMACRVVVGEYCPGVKDALTPIVRDPKSHQLFDSTVGLLRDDTMTNPSIYVTYHDAQAYPEYLIEFKAQ